MTTIGHICPKLGHFFPIFEKGQGRTPPLPPLVTRLHWCDIHFKYRRNGFKSVDNEAVS